MASSKNARTAAATSPPAPGEADESPRPQRRRDAEVLEVAADIFYDKGFEAATIEDVANALGILKGSLYHYIDSKEDLLLRIFKKVHSAVASIQEQVAAREDLSPLEKLDLYIRTQTEYNARNLKEIAVYYRDTPRLSEERLREIEPGRQEHYRFVGHLLADAQGAGEIGPDADVSVLRHAVNSTVIWTYTWYEPEGRLSPTELGRLNSEFVLDGVRGTRLAA